MEWDGGQYTKEGVEGVGSGNGGEEGGGGRIKGGLQLAGGRGIQSLDNGEGENVERSQTWELLTNLS